MIEYWACIGLACADDDFRDQLQKDAPRTTEEYAFRLSSFELADLERLMGEPKVLAAMTVIQNYICPLPPKPCPKHSARSAGYAAYKQIHLSLFKGPSGKPEA